MQVDNIVGIDLAKNIFHVCVMNKQGRVIHKKKLSRANLFDYVVSKCTGIIAMEACGGAHYWARRFESLGFEVKQISPQFVKPFVKSQKNDMNDAIAICEAASRPEMRCVATKTAEQQDLQTYHRQREGLMKKLKATANSIRSTLLEHGIAVPQGLGVIRTRLMGILEENQDSLGMNTKDIIMAWYGDFQYEDKRIEECSAKITAIARTDANCKRIQAIPGVGPLIATAIVAAVGNPLDFKNSRQMAAWLGLVPRQNSTGGKTKLGRITKRGNCYIRKILVQGAYSAAIAMKSKNKTDRLSLWYLNLEKRKGVKKACVALAAKLARIICVVLQGKEYQPAQ